MQLSTTYLGLELSNPLIAGASPLTGDFDAARRLEDAGAGALIMHSLFEEQITRERDATIEGMELYNECNAEALSYFPQPDEYRLGPENYLEQIRRFKESLHIPVIASLNGSTPLGWLDYARQMEQAGADALELNVYYLPTSPYETGETVERRTVEILQTVKRTVQIPVSVKLSPFFSSLPHFTKALEMAGADGVALFNRFYQPDIDIEHLEAVPSLELSSSSELRLRLRWLGILYSTLQMPMSCTGGVHTGLDAIKALMAGATTVQMASALLKHGPGHLARIKGDMVAWMTEKEYEGVNQMRGSMSLLKSPDPGAFERANYMRILNSWKG